MTRPHPVDWLRQHERIADALLAVLLTGLAVTFHVLHLETEDTVRPPSWWTIPFVVGAVLPVALRRTYPIRSGLTVVAVQIAAALLDIEGSGFLGVVVALYSIGAHTSGPRRNRALLAIVVGLGVLFVTGMLVDELGIGSFISTIVVHVTAFVLGDNLRRRRDHAVGLIERAERAERENELIAHQRVAAERTRIARELHDVVAHSVSVMVIQAAAARRNLHTSPDTAETALSNIEATGRQTMNELRGILGVLRQDAATEHKGTTPRSRVPQPSLAELDTLIEACSDLPITLDIEGELTDIQQSITLTGYRVLQESLTNIRRHAGPVERVEVLVTRGNNKLDIEVRDDGRGAAADGAEPGYGLAGMAERVAAVGGEHAAGPRPGGGWRVHVTLPTNTPTATITASNPERGPGKDMIVTA
jgi:signal transduction histidine kinase